MTKEAERKVYKDLIKYVWWLAGKFGKPGHWLLDPQDIAGEAMLALARCMKRYNSKPHDEFLAIARVAMFNSVKTLVHRATLTHRKKELTMKSLEEPYGEDLVLADTVPGGLDPEAYYDSQEWLEELLGKLSRFQLLVLNAILGKVPAVGVWLDIQRERRNFVYNNAVIKIDEYTLSRALVVSEKQVREALDAIEELIYGSDGPSC